jgi:hypothetical protein
METTTSVSVRLSDSLVLTLWAMPSNLEIHLLEVMDLLLQLLILIQ